MILGTTAHRPNKLGMEYDYEGPYTNLLLREYTKILLQYDPEYIITGMAQGGDTIWVLAGMLLGMPFKAAIPFEGQEKMWPTKAQELYWNILNHELCLEKVYVCEPGYASWKMQKRNIWMLEHMDLLISAWDGSEGGTANCCIEADKRKIPRININLKI